MFRCRIPCRSARRVDEQTISTDLLVSSLNRLTLFPTVYGIPIGDEKKQNSVDEPVQVAFSVTDDQGREEIITGEIPYAYDLFRVFQENGWLNTRRGVSSIRDRQQRRTMAA